jgi:hypothetical protein
MPKDGNWKHFTALATQATEMISLFVLFLHFYKTAYSKKRKSHSRHGSGADNDSLSSSEQVSISSASTVDDSDDPCASNE